MKLDVRSTKKEEFIDITDNINDLLNIDKGTCILYCPHTTSGLTINEGADPSVKVDIINALKRLVPDNINYEHSEGNSPAHIKSSLMGSSLTILVENKKLKLGRWQSVFFCEFDGPRNRNVYVNLISEHQSI